MWGPGIRHNVSYSTSSTSTPASAKARRRAKHCKHEPQCTGRPRMHEYVLRSGTYSRMPSRITSALLSCACGSMTPTSGATTAASAVNELTNSRVPVV